MARRSPDSWKDHAQDRKLARGDDVTALIESQHEDDLVD
jgi:hypothetical protein